MNWHSAISAKDEGEKNFYIVFLKYFLYTLQEYVESNGNKLASNELICNAIYTYTGQHRSRYYIYPCTGQKIVTV